MTSVSGLSVLIVEDDEDTRDILEIILVQSGASVRVAGSAGEGRAAIQQQAPDVILADLSLPDEDGCAFIASVREGASSRAIPAIALTGHGA
jgi:CheY-like chemotaxis protein